MPSNKPIWQTNNDSIFTTVSEKRVSSQQVRWSRQKVVVWTAQTRKHHRAHLSVQLPNDAAPIAIVFHAAPLHIRRKPQNVPEIK